MALRIGLTGGVACGKSTVAEMLKAAGAHVLDADVIARELVAPGSPALQAIIAHFGPAFVAPGGGLDRAALRARIFADTAAKTWLEALLHPLIRATFITASAALAEQHPQTPLVWVVPLLVENDYRPLLDQVLVVDCPRSVQVERLRARPGWTKEQVTAVLAAQCDRAARNAAADWIITNEGTLTELQTQVGLYLRHLRGTGRFA
ncbi:dephospho-CoA kinase [Acidithiobacillus sp. 'AMD consortium']|jgi:dephospho-CoA kinase|uniref:Dephospho-CoA kinase n=2 Tax=Acidithiobacillus ferridurans TaxID=1232575 RepID=A0A2Z6IKA1_ACIFI|nr:MULTISPECIES: dephospho-CoA kinase [Acidithiobacillus]MBU2716026.1 dephospho-CoA kinase [Acidithiobacillus ferridurans]MBU2720949.1 dephospho-CoA kinase [Acidithiobacillus ferridurans]MBU2723026.1 dephospho-CoA kinase [Acidithiobacillus ferridurans]MBU2725397.1 dephospho-CoA kinase [Acidithiobacillus ferridurans]MBU2804673.1 dephospho-CoA kinase [Acidithiobacillus ferridurans]